MGSEKNDATSFPPADPPLCANGCGFFGSPSNMNLCSRCYRDLRKEEESVASAKYAVEKTLSMGQPSVDAVGVDEKVTPAEPGASSKSVVPAEEEPSGEVKVANRCFSCRKKVGLTGFKCKCGDTFCGTHRYAENHNCPFDFKGTAREAIAKANPMIRSDKVDRI